MKIKILFATSLTLALLRLQQSGGSQHQIHAAERPLMIAAKEYMVSDDGSPSMTFAASVETRKENCLGSLFGCLSKHPQKLIKKI